LLKQINGLIVKQVTNKCQTSIKQTIMTKDLKMNYKQPEKVSNLESTEKNNFRPIAERFKTIPNVIWDVKCQQYLTDRLSRITSLRKQTNIKLSKDGKRLKRGEYDSLVELGMWNPVSISEEFLLIAQKESKLSGVVRRYVETLVVEAMNETIKYYRKIEEGAK